MADVEQYIPEQVKIEPAEGGQPVIKVEPPQQEFEKKKKIVFNKRIIWYAWLVLESLLAIRFVIKLFGANPLSIFSIVINIITFPLSFLFINLFPSTFSLNREFEVEWSTLFAMFFYFIVAILISYFYRIKKPINPQEAEDKSKQIIP